MLRTISASVALTAALVLVSCTADAPEPTAIESAIATGPSPTLGTSKTSIRSTQTEATHPVGLAELQSETPTSINSNISQCATSSDGLYEQGTTWFTDGTTGWTAQCSDRFWNGAPTSTAPAIPSAPIHTTQPAAQSTYYANCSAARAAGAAPLYAGQAGYGSHLDGDGDGIACE